MTVIDADNAASTMPDPDEASSPPVHLMTVDEYLRVSELLGWEHTELVEGVVYDMNAEHNPHARTVMRLLPLIQAAFPDDVVWNVGSMQFSGRTLVQPDLFVFDDDAVPDDAVVMPSSVAKLAIEVSSTTRWYDLGPKLRAYASAGLAEYWVVVLQADPPVLLRHTDPQGDRYQSVETFDLGDNAVDLDAVIERLTAG